MTRAAFYIQLCSPFAIRPPTHLETIFKYPVQAPRTVDPVGQAKLARVKALDTEVNFVQAHICAIWSFTSSLGVRLSAGGDPVLSFLPSEEAI